MTDLSFEQYFFDHPSLSLRRKEVRTCLRKLARRHSEVVLEFDQRRFLCESLHDAESLLSEIENSLLKIARRPYTASEVRQRLDITNQERLRLTKNGRLKRGASELMQRGQRITVITYDVSAIDKLCQTPEMIEAWRREDDIV